MSIERTELRRAIEEAMHLADPLEELNYGELTMAALAAIEAEGYSIEKREPLPQVESVFRLNIGPNDRLAVMIKGGVTRDQADAVCERLKAWIGDDMNGRVSVFANGIELAVITQEPTDV